MLWRIPGLVPLLLCSPSLTSGRSFFCLKRVSRMSVHRLSEAPLSLSHVTSQPAPVFFFFFTQFQLQRHFLHVSFIDFYVFESLHINVIKASSLKFSTTTTKKKASHLCRSGWFHSVKCRDGRWLVGFCRIIRSEISAAVNLFCQNMQMRGFISSAIDPFQIDCVPLHTWRELRFLVSNYSSPLRLHFVTRSAGLANRSPSLKWLQKTKLAIRLGIC